MHPSEQCEPQFAISNCRTHDTQVTGDYITGMVEAAYI